MTEPTARGHAIGVQSVVFADHEFDALVDELATTDVRHLELWGEHLSPGDDEATIAAALDRLDAAGIGVCGYGVVDLDRPDEAREHVAFADRLGADYVTVNYPPDADEITERLCSLAEEFAVDVAVHNYSTVHHDDLDAVFSSTADVLGVLDRFDHDRLGVCVDTGHFLVMDETPADVLPQLGDRVVAVHLKDTSDAEVEDAPGAAGGALSLSRFLDLLDRHADLHNPLVVEYELEDGATAALRDAVSRIRQA